MVRVDSYLELRDQLSDVLTLFLWLDDTLLLWLLADDSLGDIVTLFGSLQSTVR